MRGSRALLLLLVVFLAHCVAGGSTSDAPAGNDSPPLRRATPTVHASGPVDADPDAGSAAVGVGCTSGALVSSSPGDKKTKVGVLSDVTLDFCGPLDVATVTAAHVTLLAPHATSGAEATVTYDAAHSRIVIHPLIGFDADATYRVRASGLKSVGGAAVSDVATSFHTLRNPWVKREQYNPFGTILSGEIHVVDAESRIIHQAAVSGLGPDGILGTADDHLTYDAAFSYSADGSTMITTTPGADNVLGTADDSSSARTYYDSPDAPYDRYAERTKGADGVWLKGDDGYGAMFEQTHTADGRMAARRYFSGTGPDGIPFSGDEPLTLYITVSDLPGKRRLVWCEDPGPDAVWETADDIIEEADEITTDAHGRAVFTTQSDPGPDGKPFTADDKVVGGIRLTWDVTTGLWDSVTNYTGPGPDSQWGTADDVAYHLSIFVHDVDGNVKLEDNYSNPGPDKMLGTGDDVLGDRVFYAPQQR